MTITKEDISKKLTEMVGIICEGLGSQYNCHIETEIKVTIKAEGEKR